MPSKEGMDPSVGSIERVTPSGVRIKIPGEKKKGRERRRESRDRRDETHEEKEGRRERGKSITLDVHEDADRDRRRISMATDRRRSTIGQIRPMSSMRFRSVLFKSKSALSVDEYSTTSSEEELDEKQPKKEKEKSRKKDKGKGKRGKKKQSIMERSEEKLTGEPSAVEPEPQREDVNVTMRAAAAPGEDVAEAAEEKPEKKKKKKEKPPKKKKAKKVKMTAEMIEKMRIEAELEAARLEEMERKRLEEERRAAIEKERREAGEHRLRVEQLNKTYSKLEDMARSYKESTKREKDLAEWEFYIACERLPNPSLCYQMNTYLHLWDKEMSKTTMEEASSRTTDVVKLLEDLQDLLDTATDAKQRTVDNWKWVRQLFRDHQKENLEVATYKLLRNIEKNLHRIDIPTADFDFADANINLSIWLRVQLPIPLPNPRRPPKSRIDVNFPNVKMQVVFPTSIDCECMAVRAMYLRYDHLSDLCRNFYMPEVQPLFADDLLGSVIREWRVKLKYKYDNRDKKEAPKADENEEGAQGEEKEKTQFSSDEEIPTVPYKKLQPTASEMVIQLEDAYYSETRQLLTIAVPDHVINLRKFSVLGGVFCLNLVYQPPQPQYFVTMDLQMTKLFLPKQLEHVDFTVTYTPPEQPPLGVKRLPEQIEEEMKQQEEEMDKLMLVTLTWPSHVIFLELPIVCYWDEQRRVWSKKNVHDVKHNEEKGILTFRTGLFGTYGLATIRYVNLPYQAWEVKPEEDGSVTFQITAAILMLEFNVKDGLICLSQLQNSPNKALTEIIGQYFKLFKLKRKMKDAGIDIFPEPDAFCYIEGACEKHWTMEKHLYYNMAQMATCFNFAWSRWNLTAGKRSIVMQMRDYIPTKSKQKNHSMLLVTPQRASLIECTEVSQVFCDDEIEGLKFSADLYHLIKAAYSITVRKRAQAAPWQNVNALYELLMVVRVLSFS